MGRRRFEKDLSQIKVYSITAIQTSPETELNDDR